MKKKYIAPFVEVFEVTECDLLLQGSGPSFYKEGTADEEDVLGRDNYQEPNNPSNSNLWDQGW